MILGDPSRRGEAIIGSACLLAGVALAVTVVGVRVGGIWNAITSIIQRNPVIMLGFALVLILTGSRFLWQTRTAETIWSPSRAGRRFRRAVLYTKAGCPLCEEARFVLNAYQPYLPPVEKVDVASDPQLEQRYSGCVPVVELDGRRRFTGQINEVLLRRLIEGTPPLQTEVAAAS